MLTLDYGQIAGLLGLGFAFLALFTLVGFALGCVFGDGHAEDGEDGEQESESHA